MKNPLLLFHKSITSRFLAVNMPICIAFTLVIIVVFFSFSHIKGTLEKLFAKEMHQIVENARIGRELTRILADTNFLMNTFYGNEDTFKIRSNYLIRKTTTLITASTEKRLKVALNHFADKIRLVLEQCKTVNRIRQRIEAINKDLDKSLTALRNTISGRLFDMTLEGEDASGMQQMSSLAPGYLETLLRIHLRFNQLGLAYFESPLQKKKHPIFMLLDDLYVRLNSLTASEKVIADYGSQLLDNTVKYKESLIIFHQAASELKKRRDEMNREKEILLSLMGETEKDIAKTADYATIGLRKQISRAITGTMIIFIATLPIIAWLTIRILTRHEQDIQIARKNAEKARETAEAINEKIISSIQYAKMIQRSLLANLDEVKTYLPHSFFVWEPRDIVGGDIFYTDTFEDGFIVAVIDCTGHGIPGAFMTMIASTALKRITKDEGCHDPAEILKRLNHIVKTTLQQDTKYAVSDDGLDAGICFVSQNTGVRSQKIEVRRQKSEVRSQEIEVRSQEIEVRSQKIEVRSQKSEVRSQEIEVRSQEIEVRNQESGDRSQQPTANSQQPTSNTKHQTSHFPLPTSHFPLLTFAGARLPLFYVRENEVKVIRGDRQSIGYKRSDTDFDFTNHTIRIRNGMKFYLSTDGFWDQLDMNDRSFSKKRFRKLLKETAYLPFEKQGQMLLKAYEKHKVGTERQDDITVVGFRL